MRDRSIFAAVHVERGKCSSLMRGVYIFAGKLGFCRKNFEESEKQNVFTVIFFQTTAESILRAIKSCDVVDFYRLSKAYYDADCIVLDENSVKIHLLWSLLCRLCQMFPSSRKTPCNSNIHILKLFARAQSAL